MQKAMDLLLGDDVPQYQAAIVWLPQDGVFTNELRVLAGGNETNEIVISARTSAKAVDHVTSRLRTFSP